MSFPKPRWLLLAAGWLLAVAGLRAELKVGDAFPAFAPADVVTLNGRALPAQDGKVMLVDFWASWCAPCRASFAALDGLNKEYGPKGLTIVAVSIDERPAAAHEFWKRLAPTFIGLHDRKQKLVQQVVVPAMPTSYLVDRQGRVHAIHAGFHGELGALRNEIEALLAAKS